MSANPFDHSSGLPPQGEQAWQAPHDVPATYDAGDPWTQQQHGPAAEPMSDVTFRAQVHDPYAGAAAIPPGAHQPLPQGPVTWGPLPGAVAVEPHAPAYEPYAAMPVGVGRDPSRTALAAVVTFIVAIVGLWAVLAYVHSMAVTLSSVDATNKRIIGQLGQANAGLDQLDTKTQAVTAMNGDAKQLQVLMSGIDASMGGMLQGVDRIGSHMNSTNQALGTLDHDLSRINDTNVALATHLGNIQAGLTSEARKVRAMRGDVGSTATQLQKVPPILKTTNARLTFVNAVVCRMGAVGVQNKLKIVLHFIGIHTGDATINATMIPPGGWTC